MIKVPRSAFLNVAALVFLFLLVKISRSFPLFSFLTNIWFHNSSFSTFTFITISHSTLLEIIAGIIFYTSATSHLYIHTFFNIITKAGSLTTYSTFLEKRAPHSAYQDISTLEHKWMNRIGHQVSGYLAIRPESTVTVTGDWLFIPVKKATLSASSLKSMWYGQPSSHC